MQALQLFLENFVKNGTGETAPQETPSAATPEHNAKEPLDFEIQTEMPLGETQSSAKKSGAAA